MDIFLALSYHERVNFLFCCQFQLLSLFRIAMDTLDQNELALPPDPGLPPVPANSERKKSRKKRIEMMCFSCNRTDGHSLVVRRRWFFSYLLGLTFGLSLLFGPYFCQCCGSTRWMCHNMLNPRYWYRKMRSGT